jgi:hypothetical protein
LRTTAKRRAIPEFRAGTNINWSLAHFGNPIAVLLQDANGDIVDFVCAGNAQPSLIQRPVPIPAGEWGGPPVLAALSLFNLSLQRVGHMDHNETSDWVAAPISFGLRNAHLTLPFLPSSELPLAPVVLTNFVEGVWTGNLTISAPHPRVTLRATDGQKPCRHGQ